jgi:hypothetical protein
VQGSAASAGDAASSAAHTAAGSPSAGGGGGSGDTGAILGALLRSATPVHGSWGSGRLLRTSLVSMLITNDGRVLVGAVAPSVLYGAAAQKG